MEQIALKINTILVIVVYVFITVFCVYAIRTRVTTWIANAFFRFAGGVSVAVVIIYALNFVGILPSPLPALVGRNIIVAVGGVIGLASWIIYNAHTRPR